MRNTYFKLLYDSPIEEEFALTLMKYISESVDIRKQEVIKTRFGEFRIDFVIELANGIIIGIECDGEEFHDDSRDEWRDTIILGESRVTEIYRIPGSAITYHLEDVLYIFTKWEPKIFSERGCLILNKIASDEALQINDFNTTWILLPYKNNEGIYRMNIKRRSKKKISGIKIQNWQTLYKFSEQQKTMKLDELIKIYMDQMLD